MRAGWDEYFMEIAELVKTRSTCQRRNVGALIVKDNRIISTGYNGPPSGIEHCEDLGGCYREMLHVPSGERHELCRALHAEQNAIIQAAKFGVSTENATLYVTHQPCIICAKMIINSGIKKIIYGNPYPDEGAMKMLNDARIEMIPFKASHKAKE